MSHPVFSLKAFEKRSSRERDNKRFVQGRIIAVNTVTRTCVVDVGAFDVTGAAINLQDVPYAAQMPPSVGDIAPLEYSNSSPYSVRVGIGRISQSNTPQISGAVTSLAKSGSTKLQGDVTETGIEGITLTQSGQNIEHKITDGGVANAKLANMANARIKARITAGTGVPEDATATQVTALLDNFVASGGGSKKGLVPDPGGTAGTTKYLREDATFQVPPLASHDHTSTAGDGGVLTNDEHDGFGEYAEIAAPSAPAASKLRLYAKSTTQKLYYKKADGTEIEIGAAGGLPGDHGHTGAGDGGALATPELTNYIQCAEVASPSTPAAGKVRVYAKSDKKMYRKGSDGVEAVLEGAPTAAQYITLALDSTLSAERVLSAIGLFAYDGGANGNLTLGIPFWRMRTYVFAITGSTLIDGEYFNSRPSQPGGTQRDWKRYSDGPAGVLNYLGYETKWALWARMGIKNTVGSNQTFNAYLSGVDDSIGVYLEPAGNGGGTVSTTTGSATVTGSGTTFTTDFAVGDIVLINSRYYRITAIASDTSLTIQETWSGAGASGVSYKIVKKIVDQSGSSGQLEASGTGTVIANTTATLHIFGHNGAGAQMNLSVITDALDNANLQFVDAGV